MTEEDSRDEQPAEQTTRTGGSGVSRRRLMAAGAAGWATVGLAGCTESPCDDDGTGGNGGGETTTTATGQTTTTTTGDGGGGDTPTTTTTTSDGGGGGDGTGTTSCGLSSVFAAGTDVGFLVSVYDNYSGDLLDDEAVEEVFVSFPDADFDPISLTTDGPHTEHVSEKWGGKLETSDATAGTYKYDINVQKVDEEEPTCLSTEEFTLIDTS